MPFAVGDRVAHPARPEWGPGEIIAVSGETKYTVYFALGGTKLLKDVPLVRLTGPESSHPLLESRIQREKRGGKTRSLVEMKKNFLQQFPGGFEDPKYVKNERTYKVAASKLLKETMSPEALSKSDHTEVCRRALAVINRTNLVLPAEKKSLSDGMKDDGIALFSRALADLLYGSTTPRDRFEQFAKMLEKLGAAKWTIATYFRFLAEPETEIFLKPEVTKVAAEACGIELNYRPDLNWRTYESALAVAAFLKEAIKDLRPRDMIDIQSFISSA